jgi:hypothetical protein
MRIVDDIEMLNLCQNSSMRVVGFDALNYYYALQTTINVTTNNQTFSQAINISANEDVFVITEHNYSTDGPKEYEIILMVRKVLFLFLPSFRLEKFLYGV